MCFQRSDLRSDRSIAWPSLIFRIIRKILRVNKPTAIKNNIAKITLLLFTMADVYIFIVDQVIRILLAFFQKGKSGHNALGSDACPPKAVEFVD